MKDVELRRLSQRFEAIMDNGDTYVAQKLVLMYIGNSLNEPVDDDYRDLVEFLETYPAKW